jgi:hypothetical protein
MVAVAEKSAAKVVDIIMLVYAEHIKSPASESFRVDLCEIQHSSELNICADGAASPYTWS